MVPHNRARGDRTDPVLTQARLAELETIALRDISSIPPEDVARLLVYVRAAMDDCELPFRMEDAPSSIYHYCGVEAFESIVRSSEIHLSDASLSNDALEHRWAFQQFEKILPTVEQPSDAARLLDFLTNTIPPPHITCFSAKGDMLSQWRNYAQDAFGFAIGFAPTRLGVTIGEPESILSKFDEDPKTPVIIDGPMCLSRVVYDLALQENCIRVLSAKCRPGSNSPQGQGKLQLCLGLRSLVPVLKHPGFREEREWRLVWQAPVQVNKGGVEVMKPNLRRFGRRGLTSYTSFKFGHLDGCMTEVWLGPRNVYTVASVEHFLAENGLMGVRVEKSTIPYRG